MKLPDRWRAVDGAVAEAVLKELRRELADGHPLANLELRALARREDQDDVLFESVADGAVFVVHLTYAVETSSKFPQTVRYGSFETFVERWPIEEVEEFGL